jgi:DNA-binding transcriptional MerR regulator
MATQVQLFSSEELNELERRFPQGISSHEVITLFQSRGLKLSEATFRKYVQLQLLPTSKRVGRKGKHRGSQGRYPTSVVRRINLIKQMMAQDMTLEAIRESFLSVHNEMERVNEALECLFSRIQDRLTRVPAGQENGPQIQRDVETMRKSAKALMESVARIGSRLAVAGTTVVHLEEGGQS